MPNQSGYVFRKGNSFFVKYYDTYFVDGVQKRKQVCKKLPVAYGGQYRSTASVQPFVDEILSPINKGTVTASSNMLVTDFVETVYWPSITEQVRLNTVNGYRHIWENHVVGRIGKITLRDFRTADAARIISEIARPLNLAKNTLKHVKAFLSGVFSCALNLGYLSSGNPINSLRLPRQAKLTEPTYAYSLSEIDTHLAALTGQARTVVLCAALSGLRASEIRGLRWNDFDGKQVFVRRSIVKAETNPTKNASSEAPVPVIKRLADALEAHRTALGVRAAPDMPIFQNGNAKPLNLDNLALRMIKPAIEKCVKCHKLESDHKESDHPYELDKKTKFFGFHAYRRGLASNLHALGVPDLVIQKILRHSNVATTQAAYIKTTNEAQIGAMETLNTELQRRDSINESGTLQTRVIQ